MVRKEYQNKIKNRQKKLLHKESLSQEELLDLRVKNRFYQQRYRDKNKQNNFENKFNTKTNCSSTRKEDNRININQKRTLLSPVKPAKKLKLLPNQDGIYSVSNYQI